MMDFIGYALTFAAGMLAGAHLTTRWVIRGLREDEKALRTRKPTPRHAVYSTEDRPKPHKGYFWYDDEGHSHRSDTHPGEGARRAPDHRNQQT